MGPAVDQLQSHRDSDPSAGSGKPSSAFSKTRAYILGFAAAPLLIGAALPAGFAVESPILCAFRETLGLPCPFCGATRAFVAFAHGDANWLQYNGYWVLVSLATIAAVLVATALDASGGSSTRMLARPSVRRLTSIGAVWLIAIAIAPGWIWALINRENIV